MNNSWYEPIRNCVRRPVVLRGLNTDGIGTGLSSFHAGNVSILESAHKKWQIIILRTVSVSSSPGQGCCVNMCSYMAVIELSTKDCDDFSTSSSTPKRIKDVHIWISSSQMQGHCVNMCIYMGIIELGPKDCDDFSASSYVPQRISDVHKWNISLFNNLNNKEIMNQYSVLSPLLNKSLKWVECLNFFV